MALVAVIHIIDLVLGTEVGKVVAPRGGRRIPLAQFLQFLSLISEQIGLQHQTKQLEGYLKLILLWRVKAM